MMIKRGFLVLSFFTVLALGLGYGGNPEWWATVHLGLESSSPNLTHQLRSVGGLYIAMGVYWLVCAWRGMALNAALLSVLVFDSGLLVGRLINLLADATPSGLFLFFTAFEVAILIAVIWVYRLKTTERYHAW